MNSSVNCEVCGEKLLTKNLKRHFERHHGSRSTNEKNCRQVSCSRVVEVTADDTDSGVTFDTMEFRVDTETVDEAVATILENHHMFTRRAMMDILEEHFPEVPSAARHLFVTVATSAAKLIKYNTIIEVATRFSVIWCVFDVYSG